ARKERLIKHLGLLVTDEQHRFGVKQRNELLALKHTNSPHYLEMTATPIPRTIAETFFGDLTVRAINTKPIGRKPIKTFLVQKRKVKDSYKWIANQIKTKKCQVYWICPLVEESEALNVKSVKETFQKVKKTFP